MKRLYDADAAGIRDAQLCDDVGISLLARCETYHLVRRREVRCPLCATVFKVERSGQRSCPGAGCTWYTDYAAYMQSVANHYAHPGRASDAFEEFYERYPTARGYGERIVLIDQLVHSYHLSSRASAAKSVASKLFEGNKKAVVAFLDSLSARDARDKDEWRRNVAATIDGRMLGSSD